ncbi:hypothetical protein ACIP9C_10570 [Lysinibacillus sp. NPDC093210]|uniref:hypothetical protein n=1 Tax=Lysinibacillus sp. NPDC093210 TaxID=3364133 RepID=UPI00382FABD6
MLNTLQVGLDLAGLIPVVGEVADGLNGIIYAARGDKLNASLSFAAMIPVAGNAATAGKWINKGANATKDIAEGVKNANKSAGTAGKNTPSSNPKPSNSSKPPAKDSKPAEATKGTDKGKRLELSDFTKEIMETKPKNSPVPKNGMIKVETFQVMKMEFGPTLIRRGNL